jgi:heme/copper-type cytochrome/quinol oxidase subunit 1
MRITDRLSRPQQVIAVIALGLALGAAGSYLTSLGEGIQSGWYAYSPLTARLAAPGTGLPSWLRLITWLILIGVWALASIRVLRPSPDPGAPPADDRR